MEAQQPSRQDIREQLANIRELLAESRDNGFEIDHIEDDLRQLYDNGQVTRLYFDVQMARLSKAHTKNRSYAQLLTYSRKLLIFQLGKLR